MNGKESIDDELKELSPFLRDLRTSDSGLRVPKDYFDNLEASVFQRLEREGDLSRAAILEHPAKPTKPLYPWRFSIIPYAAAAALALLAAAYWYFGIHNIDTSAPLSEIASPPVSADDAAFYLAENIEEFDTEQLALLVETFPEPHVEIPSPEPANPLKKSSKKPVELTPNELKNLLQDMSDEELEELL